jgi:hypothetical protein
MAGPGTIPASFAVVRSGQGRVRPRRHIFSESSSIAGHNFIVGT